MTPKPLSLAARKRIVIAELRYHQGRNRLAVNELRAGRQCVKRLAARLRALQHETKRR